MTMSTRSAVGPSFAPATKGRPTNAAQLNAVIDLNAVPPLGIDGIEATDKNTPREHVHAWGALGIGGTKMKIHKKAIAELFTSNDRILDAEQVLELGRSLG